MNAIECLRPASLEDALASIAARGTVPGAGTEPATRVWLAGGQSLLAAMKLGLATPSVLIDLQDIPGLRDIRLDTGADGQATLWIGAMATHAAVAASGLVQRFAPGLAELAGGIADPQVREMGTLGGSLAHNDPAACWPCGVLAAGATVVTSRREIAADDYFVGLYTTALQPDELILGVRFTQPTALRYLKFEQPASRFALTGVTVARVGTEGRQVRVAITGLGHGVQRWPAAEQALTTAFSPHALQSLAESQANGQTTGLEALGDLHASAEYRRHLALVLTRRCVERMAGVPAHRPAPLAPLKPDSSRLAASGAAADASHRPDGFGGQQHLAAPPVRVWQALLDPQCLQASIPGCEALTQAGADAYKATVKVGLGPLSVRFHSDVSLRDQRHPNSLNLVFDGQAGALGAGQGTARVRLEPTPDGGTTLHWWVNVQLSGRLAQLGNRLVEASARKLSADFFQRFSAVLGAPPGADLAAVGIGAAGGSGFWRRLWQALKRVLSTPGK